MKFTKITLLTLVFSLIISIPALAIDSIYTKCTTCQTDAQFYTHAKANSILNKNIIVNVMNFKNKKIRKFKVLKNSYKQCSDDKAPNGRTETTEICSAKYKGSVIPISLTSLELNNFDILADNINDLQLLVSSHPIKIPKTVVESGYEIIGAGFIQTRAMTYFNDMPLKDIYLKKIISTGISAKRLIDAGIMEFEFPQLVFEFYDGVKAYPAFDFYDMDGQVHFNFIKAVDANGNAFNLTKSNPFSDEIHNFDGISKDSWAVLHFALNAYGFDVQGTSKSIPPTGTAVIVACSNENNASCNNPN